MILIGHSDTAPCKHNRKKKVILLALGACNMNRTDPQKMLEAPFKKFGSKPSKGERMYNNCKGHDPCNTAVPLKCYARLNVDICDISLLSNLKLNRFSF